MLSITRIFGIVIVRGTAHELESVASLRGIEIGQGEKLAHLDRHNHVHGNPGTFVDKQTIELPLLESEDK